MFYLLLPLYSKHIYACILTTTYCYYYFIPTERQKKKEAVYAALFSATAALPRVCKAMSLYLDNKATEAILLHPVQRRVVDSVDSVRDVLQRLHPAKVLILF